MILAFGFGNVWMLGWLAAAAAPIIIHLWNRRHYREQPWAATRFLLQALKTQSRRLRIEQWLLLALRVAAIAAVMFAAAQPFATAPDRRTTADPVHRIYVLDRSFSMAYRPAAETLFDHARQRVRAAVEGGPAGDGASLVVMGGPAEAVIGAPTFEPQRFLEELERVALGDGMARLGDALQIVENVIARAEQTAPALTRREVVFVSDFTQPTWQPAQAAETAEIDRALLDLASRAELQVIDVGQPQAANLAVTELRPLDPLFSIRTPAEFEVETRAYGGEPRAAELTAVVDGRTVRSGRVQVAPGRPGRWSFAHRFDAPGEHVVEVRVVDERLTPDDRRWSVVEVRDQIRVLGVTSAPDAENDSLMVALDPTQTGTGLVSLSVASEADWAAQSLERFACLVFSNVDQFSAAEARRLANYLGQGGCIVFVLGDRVRLDRYNEMLLGGADRTRLLPMKLAGVAEPGDYKLDPLGYRHPLLAAFRGQEKAGLLTAAVSRYVRLEAVPSGGADVALGLTNGDPAIVTELLGGGRVILLATPTSAAIDPETGLPWNTLPASPAMVPLVQELLRVALASGETSELIVGRSLAGRNAGGVDVRLPEGGQRAVEAAPGTGGAWSFAAERAGIYEVTPRGGAMRRYAVNVDPRESDLTRISTERLPSSVAAANPEASTAAALGAGTTTQRPLERACLFAGLALLVVEGCYAWWLGRRR
ncbi:MAG: BatA domain-containing protein [Pirellulales bacterium]